MANTLTATLKPALQVSFTQGLTVGQLTDNVVAGSASFPALTVAFANGTGANQAQLRHIENYSFASGNTDLDLTSLATTRPPGGNQTFALIKLFILKLVTPATGIYLSVGNYSTNGWIGVGGVAFAAPCHGEIISSNEIDGWTVSSSLRYLRINNPGGSAVSANLVLIGQ